MELAVFPDGRYRHLGYDSELCGWCRAAGGREELLRPDGDRAGRGAAPCGVSGPWAPSLRIGGAGDLRIAGRVHGLPARRLEAGLAPPGWALST